MRHDLPPALTAVAIALCLGAAAIAAVRLTDSTPPGRRDSDAAHLVMLVAMAAMWSDRHGGVPTPVWQLAFGLLAVTAAVRTARAASPRVAGTAAHHLVAALAMVYATLGHGTDAHSGDPSGPPFPAVGWILAALFALDAAVSVRAPLIPAPGRRTADAFALAVPHLVMDAAMTLMLVTAVR